MKLIILDPPEHSRRLASAAPTSELVDSVVRGLAWSELTFVVLESDENNWLEFSGSLDPSDGFSAMVSADGRELVVSSPPSSLSEGIKLLQSYLEGDNQWRVQYQWH